MTTKKRRAPRVYMAGGTFSEFAEALKRELQDSLAIPEQLLKGLRAEVKEKADLARAYEDKLIELRKVSLKDGHELQSKLDEAKLRISTLEATLEGSRKAIAELEASRNRLRDDLRKALTTDAPEKVRNLQGTLDRVRELLTGAVSFGGQVPGTEELAKMAAIQLHGKRADIQRLLNERNTLGSNLQAAAQWKARDEIIQSQRQEIFELKEDRERRDVQASRDLETYGNRIAQLQGELSTIRATAPSAERMKEVEADRERIRGQRDMVMAQLNRIRAIFGNESSPR